MSDKFCRNCGGVRIGNNLFCIICGSKFLVTETKKCPTCNQEWIEAPVNSASSFALVTSVASMSGENKVLSDSYLPSDLTINESKMEQSLNALVRPIKWPDLLIKGKDCLNCGCSESAPACILCGYMK